MLCLYASVAGFRAGTPHLRSGGAPQPLPSPSVLPLRFAFRWSGNGCGARLPLSCFLDRGAVAVSPSLPDPVDSVDGDPVPVSPGEGGCIGAHRRTSSSSRADSPRSLTGPVCFPRRASYGRIRRSRVTTVRHSPHAPWDGVEGWGAITSLVTLPSAPRPNPGSSGAACGWG